MSIVFKPTYPDPDCDGEYGKRVRHTVACAADNVGSSAYGYTIPGTRVRFHGSNFMRLDTYA